MRTGTTDDRGARITALHPRSLRKKAAGSDSRRAALARRLKLAIKAEARRWSGANILIAVVAVVIWIALQVAVDATGLGSVPWVRGAAVWGGIVALVLGAGELARRRVSANVVASAVAEGICGQCCYTLEGIPPEPDGCLVCPECGAAWGSHRITRPHWNAGRSPSPTHRSVPLLERAGGLLMQFGTGTPSARRMIAADDRGRFVTTPDSRLWRAGGTRRTELGRSRVRMLVRRLREIGQVDRLVIAALPGMTAILLASKFAAQRQADDEYASALLLVAGILVIVSLKIFLSHAFVSPKAIAHVLAAQGLCGSCVRPLDGIEPGPDRCRACPECGAAWRMPEVEARAIDAKSQETAL